MKKLIMVLVGLLSIDAFADPVVVHRVLKDQTTMIALDLNDTSVFCTQRGYGNVQLKISVPDLDWLAHFDHRVEGEGLPCITGGRCTGTLTPAAIIDPADKISVVPMRVILTDELTIDDTAKTCTRQLREDVKSHIRGRNFFHQMWGANESVDYEKCKKVQHL
jgi:hypothetical protein